MLSLWSLNDDKKQASFENLVAEAFSCFPGRFQLEGYPEWPNAQVVNRAWVTRDNPHLRILDDKPSVFRLFNEEPPLAIVRVLIEGSQANAQGFVTGKCAGKTAVAAVEVHGHRTPWTVTSCNN